MKGKNFTQGKWHQSHRLIPNDEDGMYAYFIQPSEIINGTSRTLV